MRMLLVEGRGYLEAWCRRAGAVRLFRLDRVEDVAVLDEPAAPPPDAAPADLSAGVFRARPDHGSAVLLLEPQARWIAEYYPVEEVVELPPDDVGHDRAGHDSAGDGGSGGRARVLLRYADPAWLVRLVLGLGGGARVLAPPELAAEVARRARASLAGAGVDGVQGAGGVQDTDGGDGTGGATARRTEAGGT
jgi:proteasome accessory factor C